MKVEKIRFTKDYGLELRNAEMLVNATNNFKSDIIIENLNGKFDAKNSIEVLSACIKSGDILTLICDGEDEDEAIKEIKKYLQTKVAF